MRPDEEVVERAAEALATALVGAGFDRRRVRVERASGPGRVDYDPARRGGRLVRSDTATPVAKMSGIP